MKTCHQLLIAATASLALLGAQPALAQFGKGGGNHGGGSNHGGGNHGLGGFGGWGGSGGGRPSGGMGGGQGSGGKGSGGNGGNHPSGGSGSGSSHHPPSLGGILLQQAILDAQNRMRQESSSKHAQYEDADDDGYEQPAAPPAPKPVLPPANKVPETTLKGALPHVEERFASVEGKAPLAVPGGVRFVNPMENVRVVAFNFAGKDYRLGAGQGALLPYNEENANIVFMAAADAEEQTVYTLASGETYAFASRAGRWELNRSVVRFQITVDNAQNPFPFYYLANATEQVVEPYKSRVLAHASPMSLTYDLGGGAAQKKIYQTNVSNFKLGGRVKHQGEDRIEMVHETILKVAFSDLGRWVLVDKADWQHVKVPALPEPERFVKSESAGGEGKSTPAKPLLPPRPALVASPDLTAKPEFTANAANVANPAQIPEKTPVAEPDRVATSSAPNTEELTAPAKSAKPAKPATAEESEIPPKLYVLSIGVSKYKDARYNLSYAHRDAQAFAEIWKKQAGLMYREVETRVLIDDEATKRNIESSLGWLEKQVTKRDNAVIMVSGHGMLDAKSRFYIATHDMDENNLKATCVPRSSVEDTLAALSGGQALVFLDTCHSGQNFGAGGAVRKGGFGVDVLKALPDAGAGVVVFTSSQADEVSLERELWGHGAFTKAFLDAMQNPSITDLNADGFLAINELDFALQERVKNLTDGQQHPSYDKSQSIKTGGRIWRFR